MATQPVSRITEEEYLELERAAEAKSEFIDGEIVAVPGGTLRHSRIAINMTIALGVGQALGNYGIFSSDARVRTPRSGDYFYPDLSVVRGVPQTHLGAADNLINPTVIVQVLSPSTANFDRGTKFHLYREIPSLEDYVLVETGSPFVEHFARQPDGSWTLREYRGLAGSIRFASIDATVELAAIYTGVFELSE